MFLAAALHVLSAVAWVGGMFFAYQVLRPVAVELLDAPVRLKLWVDVFGKFFPWVKIASALLIVTGLWMIHVMGGMGAVKWHVHLMLALALAMIGIFGYVNHVLLKRLRTAVDGQDWTAGGEWLGKIRQMVGINLILGLITVAVASGGRYL
jgi:uncharacterized membrane protein